MALPAIDISYASHGQSFLDIYGKETGDPVVFIHGGAWHLGDKSKSRRVSERLAERGFCVYAIGYRLCKLDSNTVARASAWSSFAIAVAAWAMRSAGCVRQAGALMILCVICCINYIVSDTLLDSNRYEENPPHIVDAAESVAWVWRRHGGKKRVAVMGHSAGGHLASLVACNGMFLERHGLDARSVVRCVVSISGVYSDKRLKDMPYLGLDICRSAFGVAKDIRPYFPIHCAHSRCPPHLLINAERDFGLKKQTRDMHHTLLSAGVFSRCVVVPGADHFTVMKDWSHTTRCGETDLIDLCQRFISAREISSDFSSDNTFYITSWRALQPSAAAQPSVAGPGKHPPPPSHASGDAARARLQTGTPRERSEYPTRSPSSPPVKARPW